MSRPLPKYRTFEDRFWRRVDVTPGCWNWTASCDRRGYGKITRIIDGAMHWLIAPRVSWELANGPILNGLFVLHKCDNPNCVNPEHLFLGTHSDNMADAKAKGRTAKGERQGGSKLRESDVVEIIELLHTRVSQRILAEAYSVSESIITNIKLGRIWKHVARPTGGIVRTVDGRSIARPRRAMVKVPDPNKKKP